MSIYKWGKSFNALAAGVSLNAKLNAQDVGEELAAIREKHGFVKPEFLVERAKPRRAKYHKAFEWDADTGAERYRLEQAKLMIRSVKVVYENAEGKESQVRAFTSIINPEGKGRIYIPTEEGMERRETRDEILMQCLSGLIRWRKRWAEYNELSEVIPLIDEAASTIEELVSR